MFVQRLREVAYVQSKVVTLVALLCGGILMREDQGNPVSNKRMEDSKPKFQQMLGVFLHQSLILLWQC